MNHDFNGNARSPRLGSKQENSQNAEECSEEDTEKHSESEDGGSSDERALALTEVQELVAKLDKDQLDELLSSGILVGLSTRQWVGLLPSPDQFMQYPEDVRKQMVAWNDAQIIDSSKRDDRLTESFTKSVTRNQWFSFLINIVFTGCAFAGFIFTSDPAAFGFLAIPGINVAFNIWKSRNDDD